MTGPSLTHQTSSGLGWLSAGSLLGKAFGFGSQLVLGALLIEEQYGAWAAVLGFNVFAGALREMAVVDLMIRGGRKELEENFGPVVWLGLLSSLLVAAVMVVAGFLLADHYNDPHFVTLNLLLAGTHVLNFGVVLLRGLLSVDLRFKRLAASSTAGSLGRALTAISTAAAGAGVYAFAFALYADMLCTSMVAARRLRLEGLSLRPNFSRWPVLIRQTPGLLISRLGITLTNGGDYLLLGALASDAVAGTYLFAALLINQMAAVLGPGLVSVLLPGFSRLRHDAARLRAALTRALSAQSLLVGFACGGVLACADAAIRFVWLDKWSAAILPAQLLAAGLTVRISAGIAIPALRAEGRFITEGVLSIAQGVSLPLGMWLAIESGAGLGGITASGVGLLALVQLGLIAAPFVGAGHAEPLRQVLLVLTRIGGPLLLGVVVHAVADPIRATGALPQGRLGEALLLVSKAMIYAGAAWLMLLTVYRAPAAAAVLALPTRLSRHVSRIPGGRRLLAP